MNPDFSSDGGNCAIVIPAYNERSTIRNVAGRALEQASAVVVVDDGSLDGTAEALAEVPVVLSRNERNRGKGYTLWRGIQLARSLGATAVITLDADGQHAPEDIPRLIAASKGDPRAIVIGARHSARERAPRARRCANAIADFWIGLAAGKRLRDTQSGFRLYPSSLFESLDIDPEKLGGFVFESELLLIAAKSGVPIRYVAIEATAPHGARRSHFRPVRDIARITRMVAWHVLCRMVPLLAGLRPRPRWIPAAAKSAP